MLKLQATDSFYLVTIFFLSHESNIASWHPFLLSQNQPDVTELSIPWLLLMWSRCAPKSHYCGVSLPFDVRHSMDIICLEASMTTTAGPGLTLIPFFTTQSVHIQQPGLFLPRAPLQ